VRKQVAFFLLAGLVLGPALAGVSPARAVDELDYGLESRRVASIRVEGAVSFPVDRIKSMLPFDEPHWYRPLHTPRYTDDLLMLGVDAVRNFYRRQGFHSVQVEGVVEDHDSRSGDRIVLRIVEGPRTLVRKVSFRGDSPLSQEELEKLLVHGEGSPAPYVQSQYGRDIYALRSAHLARGYLACRILLDIEKKEGFNDLVFTIESGPQYRVKEIRLEGNSQVKEHLIRRELRIASGDIFDLDEIVRSEADLLETGWFRDVGFNPADLDTVDATCALNLHVVERPSGYYEIGVGAGDRDQLRLAAAWGDRNVFGTGKGLFARVRLLWGLDDILDIERHVVFDHREELNYLHRRFLGSRYTLRLGGFFDRESRGSSGVAVERFGILASTTLWRLKERTLQVELAHELIRKVLLKQVEDLVLDDSASPPQQTGHTTTNSILLMWTRDSRDDFFIPHSGSMSQIMWQTAGGPLFGGDNSFNKLVATWSAFFGASDGSVLALRVQAGWAHPWYRSADLGFLGVPLENRFFAGGQRSVRGYRENSLGPRLSEEDEELVLDDRFLLNHPAAGGNALLVTNAELRLPMPLLSRWGFGLIFFADGGNVWEDWTKVSLAGFRLSSRPDGPSPTNVFDYRTGVGFGFLYNTPVGPIRLEYGLPLKRARRVAETGESEIDPHHIWHLSLGFAF